MVNTEINLRSLAKERPGVFEVGRAVAKPVYIAWAIQKGNTDFAKLIDDALLATRKSGKMYELQNQVVRHDLQGHAGRDKVSRSGGTGVS